ncbi:MAG: DMT family transporter [Defluviimonas sp.]|nr:DMT family transporter [Paracoccaceae bacterium]MCC0063985.1 DMT family transporter [Defluviimonas sp.]
MAETAPARPLAAALWMVGSISGFTLLSISGREIGKALDTFEMMFYRSLIGTVAIVVFALATRRTGLISHRHLGLHFLRNAVHFAGQNLWLHALALIPLAQLFAIEFSSPLIVALAAPFVLAERLTPARALAVALGFCGVLIVAQPFGQASLSPGVLSALGSAFSFAATAILTKRLTRRVPVLSILFWLAAMQSAMGLVTAGWDGAIALPHGPVLGWVLVMGLAGLGAHVGLTKALSLAPATVVTPMDFLRLPIIALVGMSLYGEPLDAMVFAGGAMILGANWLNIRAARAGARSVATAAS